jgi:hypothetical protein
MMPSAVYQNIVNLVVNLFIRRCLNKVMNVMVREHCTLDRFLIVAKFTTLNPLSLLISCKPSFPNIGYKMSSQPTLALKSNKICISDECKRSNQ